MTADSASDSEYTFISYSHDSEVHRDRVRALAADLISKGLQIVIDQYHPFPEEGWPSWMQRKIAGARFVLVVCSEPYYRRAMGIEEPGKGLGAIWESQIITQEMYEAQGRNSKFIPVVLATTEEQFIPPFLKPFQRFNLSDEKQVIGLLRLLSDQPEFVPPPLGERVVLPPRPAAESKSESVLPCSVSNSGNLVLLHPLQNGLFWFRAEHIEETDNGLTLTLLLENDREVLEARKLRRNERLGMAYGSAGFMTELVDVRITQEGNTKRLHLATKTTGTDYGQFAEGSVNDIPADTIAEMRARRILLDEMLPVPDGTDIGARLNADTLEVFIRGVSTPVKIIRSPLSMIFRRESVLGNPREFLSIARLVAILFLRLSGVIEYVEYLRLNLDVQLNLQVAFAGYRPKRYANVAEHRIEISGIVNLPSASARRTEE